MEGLGSSSPAEWCGARLVGIALAIAMLGAVQPLPAVAEENFSLRVSLERSRLRSELHKLNRELEKVEESYDKLRPTAAVGGRLGAFMAQERSELRSQRSDLRRRIRRVEQQFAELRRRVMRKYGDLPGWWSDTPYP